MKALLGLLSSRHNSPVREEQSPCFVRNAASNKLPDIADSALVAVSPWMASCSCSATADCCRLIVIRMSPLRFRHAGKASNKAACCSCPELWLCRYWVCLRVSLTPPSSRYSLPSQRSSVLLVDHCECCMRRCLKKARRILFALMAHQRL